MMAECQWTDEQLQQIVRIARRHALYAWREGITGPPGPGDTVVECSQAYSETPNVLGIGTLCWYETWAAWDEEYPDLKRPVWDIIPLSGATHDDGETVWTWENACFLVVPDLDAVLLEAMLTETAAE